MKKMRLPVFVLLALAYCGPAALSGQSDPARWTAREIKPAAASSPPVELYRPVDLALDDGRLFILDMSDNNIKVFSRAGAFQYTFGRKGQGPAEFHRPSGLDIQGSRVYVADAGNRRIQVLSKRGDYLAGFKLPFSPYRVLALEEDTIVVLGLPSGRSGPEKLLHGYDGQGRVLWAAVDSFYSGDSAYDLLRNRMFIRKTSGGEIWLVPGADDRNVLRMNAAGVVLGEFKVKEGYPLQEIEITTQGGRKRTLRPFCWNCALDGETLYLLMPEQMEDGDLGPGRMIAAIGRHGETAALIELPAQVSRIAVEGRTIFGLDLDLRLRLFTGGSN